MSDSSFAEPITSEERQSLRVLSWNLAQQRARAALVPLLAEHRPELVMLQEGGRPPGWAGGHLGHAVPGRPWGSWLLATEGSLQPIAIPGYVGWLTGAIWTFGKRNIACFSLHSPTATERCYVTECRRMIDRIDAEVEREMPLVIGGDFNFRSLGRRAHGELLANTSEESRALDAFQAMGFTFAWRSAHPSDPLPQTLRWTSNRATPYHSDGFLVRHLATEDCEVLSTEALGHPSDHDPVLANFTLPCAR